jgi:hypothetical protein
MSAFSKDMPEITATSTVQNEAARAGLRDLGADPGSIAAIVRVDEQDEPVEWELELLAAAEGRVRLRAANSTIARFSRITIAITG